MKLRIELITLLAKNAKFTKVSAECVLSDLVDKIGDVKQGKSVQECLSCIAEATSLEFICKEVQTFTDKNNHEYNHEDYVWNMPVSNIILDRNIKFHTLTSK